MSILMKYRTGQALTVVECLLMCSLVAGMSDAGMIMVFGPEFSKSAFANSLNQNPAFKGLCAGYSIYTIDKYTIDLIGSAIRNVIPTKYGTSCTAAAVTTGALMLIDGDGDDLGISGIVRELNMSYGTFEGWEQFAALFANDANDVDKLTTQFLVSAQLSVWYVRSAIVGEGLIEVVPEGIMDAVSSILGPVASLMGVTSPAGATQLIAPEAGRMLIKTIF